MGACFSSSFSTSGHGPGRDPLKEGASSKKGGFPTTRNAGGDKGGHGGFRTGADTREEVKEPQQVHIPLEGGDRGGKPSANMTEGIRAKGTTERAWGNAKKETNTRSLRRPTIAEVKNIKEALKDSIIFHQFDEEVLDSLAREMCELRVPQREKLIVEGDMGSEMYLVSEGSFEVTERRHNVEVVVNHKKQGDIFGEISLMFQSPRAASVVALTDATVWMIDRVKFQEVKRRAAMEISLQHEVFINSVPILSNLTVEEKMKLVAALEEKTFMPGDIVVKQGDVDAKVFYIVAKGEAVVTERVAGGEEVGNTDGELGDREGSYGQGEQKVVNRLFRADYFGEKALFSDQPRQATVTASGTDPLVCLCLHRDVFVDVMESLEYLMAREKSPESVARRMNELAGQVVWSDAKVIIKGGGTPGLSGVPKDIVCTGTASNGTFSSILNDDSTITITLKEEKLLGGGATGTVRRVQCLMKDGSMTFALKRMRQCTVMSTPEHIFCEQRVTKELTHFTCMRQHASFKDSTGLYFLFDYMDGCDLMDALAAIASMKSFRDPKNPFAPKIKMLQGMPEEMARYYIGIITLAFEYLHDNDIVYRDLKPENVLLSMDGKAKLGDFGFAKKLTDGRLTYTFCGTPAYVAPEVVLARGYGTHVDWWGMGILTYVLLTGQQPFGKIINGRPEDPMTVMKRIVDSSWTVSYPVYVSDNALNMMQRLIERRRSKRLGNLRYGTADIKSHPWFQNFDWELLESGKYKPQPLKLSKEFVAQHRRRIHELEQEVMQGEGTDTPKDIRNANAIFANF